MSPAARLSFVGVWVLALVTRIPALDLSLWWDEAYTAVFYVDRGAAAIFSPASFVVNNHVLFSLLAWPTTLLLGDSEPVLRLWALLPALGSLAVVTWWARTRIGPWPAVALGLVIALSPLHQDLSVQARGYGLAFLGAALLFVGAVRAHEDGRACDLVLVGAGGIVLTWTLLPTVVLFLAHAAVLVMRRATRWSAVAVVAVVGVADLAFYRRLVPLILRYSEGAGQREGIDTPWHAPLTVPVERMVQPIVDQALPGVPAVVVLVATVALLALAAWGLVSAGKGVVLLHSAGVVGVTLVAMYLLGAHIVDRYIAFLLVHVLVFVTIGTSLALRRLVPAGRSRPLAVVLGVLCVVASVVSVGAALDRAAVPWEDYREGARVAAAADVDTILLNRTAGTVGFRYYLGRGRVTGMSPELVGERACEIEERFVLFDYPMPGTDDHGDLSCVRDRAVEIVDIEQRNTRAPSYRVWVVGPSS